MASITSWVSIATTCCLVFLLVLSISETEVDAGKAHHAGGGPNFNNLNKKYFDDDEEARFKKYFDDDEEARFKKYFDDDEEARFKKYFDDDEEARFKKSQGAKLHHNAAH